jgi:hypothetical protein
MAQALLSDVTGRLRPRRRYLAFVVLTVALGLTVHFGASTPVSAWRDVLGDALWASMIFWGLSLIAPAAQPGARAAAALAVCFAVEFSQLYHTRALDALRGTAMGRLALGSGFDPRDLAAYAAGVLAAALLDRIGSTHR